MFQLYCLGDQNSRICPYRSLSSADFVGIKQKKALSDVKALMRPVENALKQRKLWHRNPTIEQVNEMWEVGRPIIAVESTTKKGRKRRLTQLAWSTHLREYRERSRVVVDEEEDADEVAD